MRGGLGGGGSWLLLLWFGAWDMRQVLKHVGDV